MTHVCRRRPPAVPPAPVNHGQPGGASTLALAPVPHHSHTLTGHRRQAFVEIARIALHDD
jgi:hypothetical protein